MPYRYKLLDGLTCDECELVTAFTVAWTTPAEVDRACRTQEPLLYRWMCGHCGTIVLGESLSWIEWVYDLDPMVHGIDQQRKRKDAAAAAVRRGARVLDEFVDDWESGIELVRLDLSDCDECVLARCYDREFKAAAIELLGWSSWGAGSKYLGFNADGDTSYDALGREWAAAIVKRRIDRRVQSRKAGV